MKNNLKKLFAILIIIILTLSAIYQIIDLSWTIYQQHIGAQYVHDALEYYRTSEVHSYEKNN